MFLLFMLGPSLMLNLTRISIMADRGFTIKDLLQELNIQLNIPPFLEGQQQLPSPEIEGRKIASLRIHVERAIGRIKTFGICSSKIPLSMARITNQLVCVCGFLSNFQPALVPPQFNEESDIDDYFETFKMTVLVHMILSITQFFACSWIINIL